MKILIFGTGKYYIKNRSLLLSILDDDEIVAFIDNKIDTKKKFEDKDIYNPLNISELSFDIILIMSLQNIKEMREQLLNLGISSKKIIPFEKYMAEKIHGEFHLYLNDTSSMEKSILIISTDFMYNGGTLAAIYAAMSLKLKKYNVWIAVPKINKKLLKEVSSFGINIAICQKLPYLGNEELFFIKKFDITLVNVFQMIQSAIKISEFKPVLWWIHEPSEIYKSYPHLIADHSDVSIMNKINVVAVSEIAKKNFDSHFPFIIKDTMSYGIPDRYENLNYYNEHKNQNLIFALIGGITIRKAQDIFLNAIRMLSINDRKNLEFWIIGSIGDNDYTTKIRDMAAEIEQVKIWGTLTRNELEKIYPNIDVVVCPSLEDPLPIVMTEGMMYKKVCIASDSTGTSQYIENGINGLICKTNDVEDLMQKMKWCIDNRAKLNEIGNNARKTYEENFTLEKFGDRLEQLLIQTKNNYKVSEVK